MADFDPPPPPPPIHDHHPPPPIPCPRINSCTLTGIPIITIFEKYQVHYELDPKLKKMALHKCRCQYVPTELDLSILTSWWSQENKTPIFLCYNYFSNLQEFYIFDKGTGGFEQVAEPRRCYPTRIGGNKVAATIYTDDEKPEEHVVIEAGHGEAPKKLIWNNGQYLKLEPMTLNTFLMKEIQELENVVSDEQDAEEGDEEDRKFKTYFDELPPYLFAVWHEVNYLEALDRKTGLYTTFIYQNKQFSRILSYFNSIFEYHLSPVYMEKYDGKCVFHCQNHQFDRTEQYIFDCTAKQFVQVFYEDLLFNPSKAQNFQDVFVSDGDAKFSIIIQNGNFAIGEFSEATSTFLPRSAIAIKTFAVQKAEKERRKKAKRHDDSDGRDVVPEKRRNEQGAQNSGANNSTAQPTQSSSGVHNFNISSAKIIIRQNPDAQQPSQLNFNCQCSQQANSQSQPQPTVRPTQQTVQNPHQPVCNSNPATVNAHVAATNTAQPQQPAQAKQSNSQSQSQPTVRPIQQTVQKPQQQPVNNSNPVIVSQQASVPVTAANVVTGNSSSVQAAVPQKQAANNSQTQQPAQSQVLASNVVASKNSNQSVNSSVSTVKSATAPSNNSSSKPQQAVQNPPQHPMNNNCDPTTVSQPANAPSSGANGATGNSSVVKSANPQSEKTVGQQQGTEVQKVQNGPQQTVQQQMQSVTSAKPNNASIPVKTVQNGPQKASQQQLQPQSATSTQSKSTSNNTGSAAQVTSKTTLNVHAASTNSAQSQQPAEPQTLTSAVKTDHSSNERVNSSVSTAKPATAASNNLRSQPQQAVQKQPKQPATDPTIAQKPAESQVLTSAVHSSQQPVNNSNPTTVSQSASAQISGATIITAHVGTLNNAQTQQPAGVQAATSSAVASNNSNPKTLSQSVPNAPVTVANVSTGNSSTVQQISSQSEKTVGQKRDIQQVQNGTQQSVQQRNPPTSATTIRAQVVTRKNAQTQQPAQAQVLASQPASAPSSGTNLTTSNSSVVQPASVPSEKTVTQKQACEVQKVRNGSQQPIQQQNPPTSATTISAEIVTLNNAPTEQPAGAQVATTTGNTNNSNNGSINSSVPTAKPAIAPSNNSNSQLQKTVSAIQQAVRNQPKQPAPNPMAVQKLVEPQVLASAENNRANVTNSNNSVVQSASPQSEKAVVQKQAFEVQKVQNGPKQPVQQQTQSQPATTTQPKIAPTSVQTAIAHDTTSLHSNAKPQQLFGSETSDSNSGQAVKPASTFSDNSQPQKTVSATQQTVQSEPKQPATDPASIQRTVQKQVSDSAVHATGRSNQSVTSSVPAAIPAIPPSDKPQSQQTVQNQAKQPETNRTVAQKPTESKVLGFTANNRANVTNGSNSVVQQTNAQAEKTVPQKQGCEVQNGPPQPVQHQTQSRPAATTQPKIPPTSGITARTHDVSATSSKPPTQLPQVSNSSQSTVKCAATSFDNSQPPKTVSTSQPTVQNQPEQLSTQPTVAPKPAESQNSNSAGNTVNQSVKSSVPTIKPATVSSDNSSSVKTVAQKQAFEIQQATASSSTPNVTVGNSSAEHQIGIQSERTVTQKQGCEGQKVLDGPQQSVQHQNFSSNPSSERNVTIQLYNNNMFWMGSKILVAQKQNAPISDSDLASILSQQQQSVNNNPSSVSQPASAAIPAADGSTGNSSEAEPAKKSQNGPQKPSRKQMQPQPVRSTQSASVATFNAHVVPTNNAQPQQPAQPKVLVSSGVASNNSNQSVNSATPPFANSTRGLEEADEDAWDSRVNARAPRLDAYGPNGDSSVAQRTRSKHAKGGQQKSSQ